MRAQDYPSLQVCLVDSNSSDGTPEMVRRCYPEVVLLTADDSKFWTGATNIGVRRALDDRCDFLVTINDDSVVGPKWLSALAAEAIRGNFPILASRLDFLDQPGLLWALGAHNDWAAGLLFQLPDSRTWVDESVPLSSRRTTFEVETLCGNGVMFRRDVFEKTGLYDEFWLPHYHADSEFVLRARQHGFTPFLTTLAVVRNDVFNDATAPAVQKAPPPEVRAGDWFAFLRRASHDARILFLSVRSDLYWRAVLAYIWRHCPRALLLQCVRKLTTLIWRRHFRTQWEVLRAVPRLTDADLAPMRLWRQGITPTRSVAPRGELSMDALEQVYAAGADFLEMAYLVLFGRPVDINAHSFRAVAEAPGGRQRVVEALLASREAKLLGLGQRGTALAKRFEAWRSKSEGPVRRTLQHVPEDLERLLVLEPEELVRTAYREFLGRLPEPSILAVQVEAARRAPLELLAAIVASPEYGMNPARRLSPFAAESVLVILRSAARREAGQVGDVPVECLPNSVA